MISSLRVSCSLLALFLVSCTLSGCAPKSNNPPTFPVTGTLTQNGRPLAGASIVFVPADLSGTSAAANTDAEGKFAMTTYVSGDGARPGDYKIKVALYEKPANLSDANINNMSYEEEQALYEENAKETPMPKNLLPKKYENQNTSGITHKVVDQPTTLDISIE